MIDKSIQNNSYSEKNNIATHFHKVVKLYPEQVALIENDKEISYSELQSQVQATANYFLKKGIKAGDRILIFVPVSTALYRSILAIFQIGATAVFLDEWSSIDRLKKACNIADCKAYLSTAKGKIFGTFVSSLRNIPIWISPKMVPNSSCDLSMKKVFSKDTALITFTTGSTGIPKAADRTHGFLNAQMLALEEKLQSKAGDIDMPALPIFVLLNLGLGVTSVLPKFNSKKPENLNVSKIVEQIKKYKIKRIISSPFFITKIAEYIVAKKIEVPSINQVLTGGAPVFPTEAKLLTSAFGESTKIEIVYGSTEAEPISGILANELMESNISMGLPVGSIFSKTGLQIIAIQKEEIHMQNISFLGTQEIGEIIVSGEHVLKSYFRNEAAVKLHKIRIGNTIWHRTGDAGYLDCKKQLHLVGKCSQLIKHNNKIYSPFLFQYRLQKILGITLGTILKINQTLTVIIEAVESIDEKLIYALFPTEKVDIKILKKIPRDPRHHTKIDYQRLKQILQITWV